MPNAETRALQLSNLYYNQGLEQAGVRDLTGAVTKLKQSLLLNKRNIQARNLLGLVYWETGEVIAALREWLISQSYQAKNNPATDYIRRVQAERTRFQNMKEGIDLYNKALENCLGGNDDMAAIQLRRVVVRSPHMIKAAQLLALIDIREGKLGQARKVLRRAEKIDRTNPLTLRYLKEISDQAAVRSKGRQKTDLLEEEQEQEQSREETRPEAVAIRRIRELSSFPAVVNVLIGLLLGILAAAFLIVPAVKRSAKHEMNTRILDYTTTLAEQKDRLESLETQMKESDEIVEKARKQVEESQSEITSYDSLVKGYNFYMSNMYMQAAEELDKIDPAKLSTGSAAIYAGIYNDAVQNAYDEYVFAGSNAFYMENYDEAIKYLEKAITIRLEEPNALELLGLAYGNKGDKLKAIQYFEELIQKFPNTNSADNAAYSIRMLGCETNYGMEDTAGNEAEETGEYYEDDFTGDLYNDLGYDPNATTEEYYTDGYTDSGYADAGYTDAGYTDTGYTDTGYTDTGYTDTGYTDAGYTDAGYTDAGYTDAGYTDTGYTDTGYDDGTGFMTQAYTQ